MYEVAVVKKFYVHENATINLWKICCLKNANNTCKPNNHDLNRDWTRDGNNESISELIIHRIWINYVIIMNKLIYCYNLILEKKPIVLALSVFLWLYTNNHHSKSEISSCNLAYFCLEGQSKKYYTSRNLLVQSQQWRHQNNVWHSLKVRCHPGVFIVNFVFPLMTLTIRYLLGKYSFSRIIVIYSW